MPKLTLGADKRVIERAKRLAAARGTSVSAMFSQFVEGLADADAASARPGSAGAAGLGPITRKAKGLVKLPADRTDPELIEQAVAARHKR